MSQGSLSFRLANEALLLAMVAIWAGNYSLVKAVLREVPPLPFNAVRLAIASVVFVALLGASRWRGAGHRSGALARALENSSPITRRDWLVLLGLGFVGHFAYQFGFIGGLSRTSVANSALIVGCSPIAIGLLTAAVGQERIGRLHWVGAALSVCGLYLVAAHGAAMSHDSLLGDVMVFGSTWCWAIYTVYSRPLLTRLSPLVVTGYSMALGTALFVPATLGPILSVDWGALSVGAWALTVASALLALNLAYLIWYSAVQRIGNARTSIYSNLVPVAAMLIAWTTLGEPVAAAKWMGAGAVMGGVLLTRLSARRTGAASPEPPAEE